MTDESILKATGFDQNHWYGCIQKAGLTDAPHKEIADFLSEFTEVDFWWAQSITVEYEKHIGRRIIGQTSEGAYQIGVSKTIRASSEHLWEYLESPEGIALILGGSPEDSVFSSELASLALSNGSGPEGISAETTTYKSGSHFRMQFTLPGWPGHSILQVRVEGKGRGRSVITFHHEKLPDITSRDVMRDRWKSAAAQIARAVTISS